MAHYPPEREDGDDETFKDAVNARQWLRREVSKRMHTDPLYGMLADLEHLASPYYLGMDYSDDLDDVDDVGPF